MRGVAKEENPYVFVIKLFTHKVQKLKSAVHLFVMLPLCCHFLNFFILFFRDCGSYLHASNFFNFLFSENTIFVVR